MDEAGCSEYHQQAEERLREDLCLDTFNKDQIVRITEGCEGDEKARAQ